jgi:NAD+ dependent glucose-6-phosphate dehydrogenase
MAPLKVLVTGACGLIGHCAYLHLRDQPERYEVHGLDRSRSLSDRVPGDHTFDIPDDRFHEVNLADEAGVRRAVEGMDVVVHMAADPSGQGGWESLRDNNVIGTYHMFEACLDAGVRRLIPASTIQVVSGYTEREPYKAIVEGRYDDVPADYPMVTAAMPAEPRNLYASSKVWTESLARTYSRKGLSCLVIRPGWVVDDDRPRRPESAYVWCSQRDIVALIEGCINAPAELAFGIFFGMSDNRWRWVDVAEARDLVGYVPQDRAEDRL